MKKSILLILILGLATLACSFSGVTATAPTESIGVETLVAGTMQALTAAAPPPTATPNGIPVSSNGATFLIPNGLAGNASATSSTEVELPYIYPSFGEMPLHTVFHLDQYPIQGHRLEPEIMIFRAAEYAQYTEKTAQIIADLKNLQYSPGQPLPENLQDGVFQGQVQPIQFQNGKGIRYLVQFDQAPLPANNAAIYYYFHGLTDDGLFYIQAFLPIHASFLVADDQPTSITPPDGVQFDWTDFNQGFENFSVYREAINRKLDTAEPGMFTPSLADLDALIRSIRVSDS